MYTDGDYLDANDQPVPADGMIFKAYRRTGEKKAVGARGILWYYEYEGSNTDGEEIRVFYNGRLARTEWSRCSRILQNNCL